MAENNLVIDPIDVDAYILEHSAMETVATRFGRQRVWIACFVAVTAVVLALVVMAARRARNVPEKLTVTNGRV